jgi:hypothetical protein
MVSNLKEKVEALRCMSRFRLAEIKKQAERGEGPLAGLTRFEIAQVEKSYENMRTDGCLREDSELSLPKKKIAKAEANSISEEIREELRKELGVYLLDLVVVDETIDEVIQKVIKHHFEIIEFDESNIK